MASSEENIAGGKSQQFTIPAVDKIFHFYKPKPPLSKFVENFWIFENRGLVQKPERILPTGTFELAINLRRNELSFVDTERSTESLRFSGAVVSGAHGRSFAPDDSDEVVLIGVHFAPGGAFPFLGFPAHDLADTHVDLATLWGTSATLLHERLSETKSANERFRVLEAALLDRLHHGVEQHYAVSSALEMFSDIRVGPTIREAAKNIGLSERRFIQVFKNEVGLTPKLFSRIQRFQQTRSLIGSEASPSWSQLALDLGYFDQSHFIRDFVEFAGLTPTDYLDKHNKLMVEAA